MHYLFLLMFEILNSRKISCRHFAHCTSFPGEGKWTMESIIKGLGRQRSPWEEEVLFWSHGPALIPDTGRFYVVTDKGQKKGRSLETWSPAVTECGFVLSQGHTECTYFPPQAP